MEKKKVVDNQVGYPSVSEPHFDDEWTVFSARPVVPLVRVSKGLRRRRLKLFAAFLAAMGLGVVVALTTVRLQIKFYNDAQKGDESDRLAVSKPAPETATENPTNSVDTADSLASSASISGSETAPNVTELHRNAPRHSAKSQPELATSPGEDSTLSAPQAQLSNKWEEERPRQVTIRPRRLHTNVRGQRGLSRIEEIFEGPK